MFVTEIRVTLWQWISRCRLPDRYADNKSVILGLNRKRSHYMKENNDNKPVPKKWGAILFYTTLVVVLVFFWWLLIYSHGITPTH